MELKEYRDENLNTMLESLLKDPEIQQQEEANKRTEVLRLEIIKVGQRMGVLGISTLVY